MLKDQESFEATYQQVPRNITPQGPSSQEKTFCLLDLVEVEVWCDSPFHQFQIQIDGLVRKPSKLVVRIRGPCLTRKGLTFQGPGTLQDLLAYFRVYRLYFVPIRSLSAFVEFWSAHSADSVQQLAESDLPPP
jgi:hypothetical protein